MSETCIDLSSPLPSDDSDSDIEEPMNTQQKIPSKMCEICSKAPKKYTCPGCEINSCCLECVKEHKERFNCTGERNKTEFVKMSEYSQKNLLNDYRFLEEAGRALTSRPSTHSSMNRKPAGQNLNKRAKLLMGAANKRGVRLKMMTGLMHQHKTNTSFYTISSDHIDWHIIWRFEAAGCRIPHQRVPESDILLDAANKNTNPVNFPHLRKPLELYRKTGLANCRFLLKVEGLPANRQRFFQLDSSATIGENLKGHNLIEHPTITILPNSYDSKDYTLLTKDDFPHMDSYSMRHLSRAHPAFNETDLLEVQILDPASNLYQPVDCNESAEPEPAH